MRSPRSLRQMVFISMTLDQTPEAIAENWDAIANSEPKQLQAGFEQTFKFLGKAAQAKGISLE